MGIRYYAYPVAPHDIEEALRNPCRFHGDDPLMDAWSVPEHRPRMLYLDKCWGPLQRLFGLDTPQQRPAAELVRGDVQWIDSGRGWEAYERVLLPDEVAEIAADLDAYLDEIEQDHVDDGADDFDYAQQFLKVARDFTREMTVAGYGLIYLIG